MITSKDLFMDNRIRSEIDRINLQKLGREGYLTVRQFERMTAETVKPKEKVKK